MADLERCITKVKNAIIAQDPPLKMAQTRLKKRSRRPQVENCNDEAHNRLITEVAEIQQHIKLFEAKLEEACVADNNLKKDKERMEQDVKVKKNSLLIDHQWCMSKRRTFPYSVVLLVRSFK